MVWCVLSDSRWKGTFTKSYETTSNQEAVSPLLHVVCLRSARGDSTLPVSLTGAHEEETSSSLP